MILDFLGIKTFFQELMISLVGGVYQIVNYTYQIFMVLAETNIFEQSDYASLTEKIYVILGVVMMFIIAYNFLMLVVDPDKNKGGAAVEKTLKKIVISFIMIVICPSLFSFAFKVSDAVMNQGIFANFFSNVEIDDDCGKRAITIKDGGNLMAGTTFAAFFNAADGDDKGIKANGNSLAEIKCESITKGAFSVYKDFAEKVADGDVDFNWFVALIAGVYLCYVIISFSFDLAIRIVKLAFYQIIAPMAIAARILPDKESIYKNWLKATTQTFISAFIRVFIMNISIYLISLFSAKDFFSDKFSGQTSFGVIAFANVFIILGIVTFMKVASKLINDIFGLEDVSLGIREKLKTGGAFAAGTAIGSGVTSMTRNATHAIQNIRDAKGGKAKAGAFVKGIGSTFAGGVSGTARGMKYGWTAGSEKDMVSQARGAIDKTTANRDKREAYRASHDLGKIKGTMPIIGGIAVAAGHIKDAGKDIGRWAGIDNVAALERQNKAIAALVNAVDGVKDTARDVISSDALQKNKANAYGIEATQRWTTSKSVGTDDHGVRVELSYNTEEYRRMQQAIDAARAAGRDTISYTTKNAAGADVTYEYSVGRFQELQGLYLKEFSEQVANQAALSSKAWEAADEDVRLQLDKVRTKAVDLRNALEDGINSSVIEAANETARAAGKQEIDMQTVSSGNLRFDGDNALGKLGDKAKLQTQENYAKIKKEQEESKK